MNQLIRVLRHGRRRQCRHPYRQGDLDGLCGVYSVVNAVRALCPELDQEGAEWLFAHLMHSLEDLGVNLPAAVASGIGRVELGRLIRAATAYVAEELEIQLTVKRLPKALRLTSNLAELWHAFEASLSPECVAIIGVAGIHSHWTIAAQITPKQVKLYDSGRIAVLRRGHCTVAKAVNRHGIPPKQVFLIARQRTA